VVGFMRQGGGGGGGVGGGNPATSIEKRALPAPLLCQPVGAVHWEERAAASCCGVKESVDRPDQRITEHIPTALRQSIEN
jgi:hypothetical protein